jgi:WXG100 family type VII secretion target
MSQEGANKLETWFAGLPGIVQSTLHEPYTWMDNGLRSVSGDPQALLAAAPHYLQYAQTVNQLAAQQLQDRAALAGHWDGDAYQSFSETVDFVDQQLNQLSAALTQVPDLLKSGAQACVEGANMIIDLVTSLIMFAVSALVTNLALSLLTAGVSVAAFVAEVLAKAAQTVAQVARVVEKVGAVMAKVLSVLERVGRILRRIEKLLKELGAYLTREKEAVKAAKGMDRVRKQAIFTAKNVGVSKAVQYGTGGIDSPPGGFGLLVKSGREYGSGWGTAGDVAAD